MTRIKHRHSNQSVGGAQWNQERIAEVVYGLDAVGNKLTNTVTYPDENSRTEAYGYDALSRLIGVDYEYSGGTPQWNDAWWYYAVGNRQPASNHSYNTHNAANMLTDSNGSTYTDDWNGNTLAGGGRSSTWDSQNRLVQTAFNNVTDLPPENWPS